MIQKEDDGRGNKGNISPRRWCCSLLVFEVVGKTLAESTADASSVAVRSSGLHSLSVGESGR